MRATLTGLALAGALSLFCYQSAYAVPADALAMKRAANDVSTVQEAQFYARVPPGTASSSATGNSSWGGPSAATSIAGGGSHVLVTRCPLWVKSGHWIGAR